MTYPTNFIGRLARLPQIFQKGSPRSSGKDRVRFYEYSLGSSREARGWYFNSRHILPDLVVTHRLQLLTQIIRLLLVMIPDQRSIQIRRGRDFLSRERRFVRHPRHGSITFRRYDVLITLYGLRFMIPLSNAGRWLLNRRDFLRYGGTGFSGIALLSLLSGQKLLGCQVPDCSSMVTRTSESATEAALRRQSQERIGDILLGSVQPSRNVGL